MTVTADCSDCDSVHTVAVRVRAGPTTKCPNCDSKSYSSRCDSTTASEDELRDQLLNVDNVGPGIIDNLESQFGTLTLLKTATVSEVVNVDSVGPTTAERILNVV